MIEHEASSVTDIATTYEVFNYATLATLYCQGAYSGTAHAWSPKVHTHLLLIRSPPPLRLRSHQTYSQPDITIHHGLRRVWANLHL